MFSFTRLAVFASGRGSNAVAIFRKFEAHPDIQVALLVCNNPKAEIINQARHWKVPVVLCSNGTLAGQPEKLLQELQRHDIAFIALAGFVRLLPEEVVIAYRGRIFNLHPSLLPKYGGRGMYGLRVHEAVLRNKEPRTGITIHEVSEVYDKGRIVFSESVPVEHTLSAEELAAQVATLEHRHYPHVLAEEIRRRSHLLSALT